jgi:predicted AlkP superfamily pyrophosphatase or phosphodiesterase
MRPRFSPSYMLARQLIKAENPRGKGLLSGTLALVVLFGSFNSAAQAPQRKPEPSNSRPNARLVLLIVVDQFRYDYLERFGDLFGRRGIGRMLRKGASWTNTDYDQMPTYTAPGHASLMTGSWPNRNGIVANEWYERETGRKVSSVTDAETKLLGGRSGASGYSPQRLLCPTVGDELRSAGGLSKVIGISAKARSAILPSGKRASAAYWYSTDTGGMVSSTYYFDQLPDWVRRFNDRRMVDGWFGAHWDRLLPEREYLRRAGKDDVPWENRDKASNDTNTFPHVVTGGASAPAKAFYRAIDNTPFSNDFLLAFTQEAITNEKLGEDDQTDVLAVSFSANDYVGHRFGPFSHEAMDMALRVDRQIGSLLDFIDDRIGLRNTVVAFTSDHGVVPVPEHPASMRLNSRRSPEAELRKIVEDGLKARYGRRDRPATDYIQTFTTRNEPGVINSNFYLNYAALKRDGIDRSECERVVGELAMKMPGAARYFTRTQLEATQISQTDPMTRRVLNGFNSGRSGDVILVLKPYNVLFDLPDDPTDVRSTTTHGSPYRYDTHVPLIIMGKGFAAGKYAQAATPADIAPTLAHMLKIQTPSCSAGRILREGLVSTRVKGLGVRR